MMVLNPPRKSLRTSMAEVCLAEAVLIVEPISSQQQEFAKSTQQTHDIQFIMFSKAALTFFCCCSSSAGYHFCALWLGCGIVLSPLPNVFVSPTVFEPKVADILASVTKIKKIGKCCS